MPHYSSFLRFAIMAIHNKIPFEQPPARFTLKTWGDDPRPVEPINRVMAPETACVHLDMTVFGRHHNASTGFKYRHCICIGIIASDLNDIKKVLYELRKPIEDETTFAERSQFAKLCGVDTVNVTVLGVDIRHPGKRWEALQMTPQMLWYITNDEGDEWDLYDWFFGPDLDEEEQVPIILDQKPVAPPLATQKPAIRPAPGQKPNTPRQTATIKKATAQPSSGGKKAAAQSSSGSKKPQNHINIRDRQVWPLPGEKR
jgi:hypothetical protein